MCLDEGVSPCLEVSSFTVLEQFLRFLKKVVPKYPQMASEMYIQKCQSLSSLVDQDNQDSFNKKLRKLLGALAQSQM